MKFFVVDNRKNDASDLTDATPVQIESDKNILIDRGFLFGDGFFTTGLIVNGKLSQQVFHYNRLLESAKRLAFNQFKIDHLFDQLELVVSSINSACIRITISRGQQKRGYAFEKNANTHVTIQLTDFIEPPQEHCELFWAKTPISSNSFLAGLKHLNRLDNVFAAQEITALNQESLMCLDEQVICGSRSNLFIYIDNCWYTPKIDRAGILGITRQRVINRMQELKIPLKESPILRSQIEACEAAFVTNSLIGLWSASKIGNKALVTDLSERLKCQLMITP